jgi:hypothetical protein
MRTFKKNENGVIIMTESFDGYENQKVVTSEQIKIEVSEKSQTLRNIQESIGTLQNDLVEVEKLEGDNAY